MTRGEIYAIRLPTRRGHEQHGRRYGVIVQADELLGLSTVLVAPTSRCAAAATFRPQIVLEGALSRILVEQLRAVDVQRLERLVGRIEAREQQALDEALSLVLALA